MTNDTDTDTDCSYCPRIVRAGTGICHRALDRIFTRHAGCGAVVLQPDRSYPMFDDGFYSAADCADMYNPNEGSK